MSITWVRRIGNGRRASSRLGQTTYDVPFLVKTSVATDDAVVIQAGFGTTFGSAALPTVGQTYSYDGHVDATAVCVGHEINQVDQDRASRLWLVVAEFSQVSDTAAQTGNPINRAARYSTSYAQFTAILERDLDNKPVVNAAGLKFDEPVEVDDTRQVFHIRKNIDASTFDYWVGKQYDYKDAVNSDVYRGWQPKTVKVVNFEIGEQEKYQTQLYHPMVIDLATNRDGWQLKVANMSRMAKDLFDNNKLYHIRDKDGEKIIDPIFIKPDGSQYPLGAEVPNYLDWKGYKELPFSLFLFL